MSSVSVKFANEGGFSGCYEWQDTTTAPIQNITTVPGNDTVYIPVTFTPVPYVWWPPYPYYYWPIQYWPPTSTRFPHKCPICEGKGKVAGDFYNKHGKKKDEERCRSCNGTGIVWSI